MVGQNDNKKCAVMALSTGAGIYASGMLTPYLPNISSMLPVSNMYDGTVIESRRYKK